MIHRTYLKQFNTIVSDSKRNHGYSPTCELVYGYEGRVSRALIYFDHKEIADKIESGEMPHMEKMKHTLHIYNAASINKVQIHQCGISSIVGHEKIRACSFDLIFFLIPAQWDGGKGFTYHELNLQTDYYPYANQFDSTRLESEDACNWYQRRNGLKWAEEGVYSSEFLSTELDKYVHGDESVVIGMQRFDVGNENIDIDITDTVNKFITGELENYGIGIAYSPVIEGLVEDKEQYLGLLTHKTPLFFEPYVETLYQDGISDDRSEFVLNKKNRLYLYATIGSKLTALDELPVVTVRDSNEEVMSDIDGNLLENIQAEMYSNGVYYIEFTLGGETVEENTMIYDTWSNIKYNGVPLADVELYAHVKPTNTYFQIGNAIVDTPSFTPNISGIGEREQIRRGDKRKLIINPRPNYTTNTTQLIDGMKIRLYIMDGLSQYDVIKWDNVEKSNIENYYVLDTNILPPQRYYVDIKIEYGMDSIIHHDLLKFDIVNNLNEKYH